MQKLIIDKTLSSHHHQPPKVGHFLAFSRGLIDVLMFSSKVWCFSGFQRLIDVMMFSSKVCCFSGFQRWIDVILFSSKVFGAFSGFQRLNDVMPFSSIKVSSTEFCVTQQYHPVLNCKNIMRSIIIRGRTTTTTQANVFCMQKSSSSSSSSCVLRFLFWGP